MSAYTDHEKRFILSSLVLIFSMLLPLRAPAAILNYDSGFESPILTDETILSSASFEYWDLTTTSTPPPTLIHHDAEANDGAQYLEFQADGSNSHTQTIGQNLGVDFAANDRFLFKVRLRRSGVAPAGNLELRVLTAAGSVVKIYPVPYSTIETKWRSSTLWPVVPLVGDIGEEIRIEIRSTPMGADPAFSIFLDDVRFETVELTSGGIVPNPSFETPDVIAGNLTPPVRAIGTVDSWIVGSPHSGKLTLEFDGGSAGGQYIRASAVSGGSQWNTFKHKTMDGSFLSPTCIDGDHDGVCRFEITVDARYSGIAPESQGVASSELANIWINLFAAGHNGDDQNLLPRRKLGLWNLTDEFQPFRLKAQFPKSTVENAPDWQLGDSVDLHILPGSTLTTGSAVDIDNVQIDRIEAPEMLKTEDLIFLDTTRSVPTRFLTDISSDERLNNGSVYRFFLPPGIDIIAAGNDPGVNKRAGNPADIYEQPLGTGSDEWIDGERYHVVELVPEKLHPSSNAMIGPIYLSSTMPADTRAKIYYETSWNTGPAIPVRRSVAVLTTEFPSLTPPQHWMTSLWWITVSDQISWPNFLQEYGSFGFNAVGGQEAWDGYVTPANAGVSPTASAFYQAARTAGFNLMLNSSPWNSKAEPRLSIDAVTGEKITGAACPAYGLMSDESLYGGDATHYTNERDRIAAWVTAVQPDVLDLDSEGFRVGAEVSLRQNGHAGCKRCDDYLAIHQITSPGDDMAEALIAMGVQRTADLNAAIVAAGGFQVPEMGYYNNRANHTYHQVWDQEALVAAGETSVGFTPYYSKHVITGESFRLYHAEAQAANLKVYPILGAGSLAPRSITAGTYDGVNELLASGAPGLVWFPSQRVVGSDLYYYGKALEALLPFESRLVNSVAVPGVTATVGNPNDPDPARYRLRATAVNSGNDYIILVSSYGNASTSNEDPAWIGPIDLTLPSAVSGDVVRLANNTIVGTVTASNNMTFNFEPGIAGARTAVFHLCDTSAGSCVDTDGDGLRDDVDNCPSLANPSQINTDGDTQGNLCDADDDNDGLLDTYEISIGTQPLNVDTDGDTFNDGVEVNAGSDPLDRLSIPIFSAPILTPLASLLLCLLLILSAGYQLTLPLRCSRPIHSRKTQ